MFKTCTRCKTKKPFNDFYKHKLRKDGYDEMCKICKKDTLNKTKSSLGSYLVKLARESNLEYSIIKNIWTEQGGNCALTTFPMTHSNKYNIYNAKILVLDDKIGTVLVCTKVKEMIHNLTYAQLRQFCYAIIG